VNFKQKRSKLGLSDTELPGILILLAGAVASVIVGTALCLSVYHTITESNHYQKLACLEIGGCDESTTVNCSEDITLVRWECLIQTYDKNGAYSTRTIYFKPS
jgi:hypothetical protein